MAITFTHETSHGVEHTHTLPSKFDVCHDCEGHGTHLAGGIREHAYTADELDEAFDDDEDRAAYFTRGGRYDVECETCHGQRVVAVVDEQEANRTSRGRRLLALYTAIEDRNARDAAERRREEAMGY